MTEIIDGYKTKSVSVSYGGVNQRWLVVFSEAAYTREMVTFNKNLQKKRDEAENHLWHVSTREFACETDATLAVKRLIKELKFHDIQYQVSSKPHYATKGKPKADATPSHYGWVVTGTIIDHQKKIQQATARKGLFIPDFLSSYCLHHNQSILPLVRC